MIALWWTIGVVGYLLVAVAVSCGLYWSIEHADYDRTEDAALSMIAGAVWPVLVAVAPIVAVGAGWYQLVRLPDRRKERAARTAQNIRVLESEIYGGQQIMRDMQRRRQEDLPWE